MTDTLTTQKLERVHAFWKAFSAEAITPEHLRSGWTDALIDEFYTEDVVFDLSAVDWPESQIYEGHGGIRTFWETWFGAWESVKWELEGVEAVGDLVMSAAVQRGIATSGGAPVEWRLSFLSAFRDSKVSWVRFFSTPEEAVAVAHGRAGEAAPDGSAS